MECQPFAHLADFRAIQPARPVHKKNASNLPGWHWCGDCINQCPIFDHFATASPAIALRFLDRDALPAVRNALAINGGHRVPMVVFLSEDWHEVSRYGERTLSTYRRMAASQLGPSCPTGLVPPDDSDLGQVNTEWLAEFERAHLILRLSPRLRARYGD